MIQRVLERCAKASSPKAVVLCTDSQALVEQAASWGFDALLTSASCKSGSERLASVVDQLVILAGGSKNNTLIINVQGDQPFVDPQVIDKMIDQFRMSIPTPEVLTPIYEMLPEKIHNPNVVKTLIAADGRALYFSRSALPHVRGVEAEQWHAHTTFWGHVGIYGYRADVLKRWCELPESHLENLEKLEQLRLIEAGIQIGTFLVEGESLSVDTEVQLELARAIAASHAA